MTEQQIKKGLFILWIVVSVCWIGFVLFVALFFLEDFEDLFPMLCFLTLPPVILLILGKSIFWILKGFKKSD